MTVLNSYLQKIRQNLLPVCLALAFGVAALLLGIFPLSSYLNQYYQQFSYTKVDAEFSELRLLKQNEGSEFRLLGRLRYRYLHDQFDMQNQLLLQSDTDEGVSPLLEMQQKYQANSRQTILINPALPQKWVLQQAPKSRQLLLTLPFFFLFSLISWLCWRWAGLTRQFDVQVEDRKLYQRLNKWLGKSMPIPIHFGLIISDERIGLVSLLVFSAFWNAIALPLSYLAIFSKQGQLEFGWHWFVLLFPAIGFIIVFVQLRRIFLNWQFGSVILSSPVELTNTQGQFNLRCYFERALGERFLTKQSSYQLEAELTCQQIQKRDDDQTVSTLYQHRRHLMSMHGSTTLDLQLPIQPDLPASHEDKQREITYVWNLTLKLAEHTLMFVLPVAQGEGLVNSGTSKFDRLAVTLDDEPEATSSQGRWWLLAIFVAAGVLPIAWSVYQQFQATEDTSYSEVVQQAKRLSLSDLQRLQQSGADFNQFDHDGKTPLMYAAENGELEHIQFLLQHGAKVDRASEYQGEIGGRTALFAAIEQDAIGAVVLLLDAGADIKQRSNKVWTPVHYAAYKGAIHSLRELARRGADLEQKFQGGRGSTPLMIAAQYQQLEVIHYLLHEAKVDKSVRDDYAQDACSYARYFQKQQALQALACD